MEKWAVSYTDNAGFIVQEVVEASNIDEVDKWCEDNGYKTYSRTRLDYLNSLMPLVSLSGEYAPEVIATSKLAKVEIAAEDCNIGGKEVDGRHYFTFDEALELQEKLKDTGWRLPTRSEWVLICEEFGQTDGELNPQTLYKNLNMSPTGFYDYEDGKPYNRTTAGYWWSTTRSSATNANYLGTNTTNVYPQASSSRGNGFALRLVRDVEEEEE